MKLFTVGEPLNRGDLVLGNGSGPGHARPLHSSIDQDGAGAALALAAAVLGSDQIEVLAQYGKKAGFRIGVNRTGASIDSKGNRSH